MGFFLIFGFLYFFSSVAMENSPEPLRSIVASYISTRPQLINKTLSVNLDIQELINRKIVSGQIKPALFPIKFNKPNTTHKIKHGGVCGLETISKSRQIISIGCDGKIAICNEDAMDTCDVVNTKTSWHCATLQCEPLTLCLGDLAGTIGQMGINEKKPHRVYKAHDGAINGLSLSSDQQHIVSCSNDCIVKVWDIQNAANRGTIAGHTKAVRNAFFLVANQKIVSGAADHTIRLWDVNRSKEEQCYSLEGTIFRAANIFKLARLPHEQLAVAGLNNGMVTLWDLRINRFFECLKGHNNVVSALMCSEDGTYIVSASWDRKLRLWDIRMPACAAILAYHKDWIQSVASLHDFERIISGSRDGFVKTLDISTVLAVAKMNNLKETAAKAALIASEKPITNDERLAVLKRITK